MPILVEYGMEMLGEKEANFSVRDRCDDDWE